MTIEKPQNSAATPVATPQGQDLLNELKWIIRSKYGLICIETDEEERAEGLLKHLADDMGLIFFSLPH